MEFRKRTRAKMASESSTDTPNLSGDIQPSSSPQTESTSPDNLQAKAVQKAQKHPTTIAMVVEAMEALGSDKNGVSAQAIKKWITTTYSSVQENRLNLNRALVKALLDGTLVRPPRSKTTTLGAIGSFCLPKQPPPKNATKISSKQKDKTAKNKAPQVEIPEGYASDSELTINKERKTPSRNIKVNLRQKSKNTKKKALAFLETPQDNLKQSTSKNTVIISSKGNDLPISPKQSPSKNTIIISSKGKTRNTRKESPSSLETSKCYVSDSEITINKSTTVISSKRKAKNTKKEASASVETPEGSESDSEVNIGKDSKQHSSKNTVKISFKLKAKNSQKNASVSSETSRDRVSDTEETMTKDRKEPSKNTIKNTKNRKAKNTKKKTPVSKETPEGYVSDSEVTINKGTIKTIPERKVKNTTGRMGTPKGSVSDSEVTINKGIKISPQRKAKNTKNSSSFSDTPQKHTANFEETWTSDPKQPPSKNTSTDISFKRNSKDIKKKESLDTAQDLVSDSEVTNNRGRTTSGWLHLSDTELDDVRKSIAFEKKPKRAKKANAAKPKAKAKAKGEEDSQPEIDLAPVGRKTRVAAAKDVDSAKPPKKTKATAKDKEHAAPKEKKVVLKVSKQRIKN